jgi:NAD(P)-dependent dehydrogenase (short-subunit alcohol dehydrogenase family)
VRYSKAVDIRDYDAVRAMSDEIHESVDSIDVVMNVAGIAAWGTVDKFTHEQWRRVVDVNLMGPIHVIECFVPPMMKARRGGHLVNVSSSAGIFGFPWHAAYSGTKFGLRGISEVLRFDLRRYDIGVQLVCPGGVDTGLVNTVEIAGVDRDSPELQKHIGHFRRRAVTPDEAAASILKGIERNRYWVYTSRDIQIGHFMLRRFEWPYTLVMRLANGQFTKVMKRARTSG